MGRKENTVTGSHTRELDGWMWSRWAAGRVCRGCFFFFFLIAERNVCFRVVTENAANIRVIPNDQHGPDNG